MNTPYSRRLILPGSRKPVPSGDLQPGIKKDDLVDITLKLRPGRPLPDLTDPAVHRVFSPLSREAFSERYGTSQADIDQVEAFAKHEGFTVVRVEPHKRAVVIRGTVAQLEQAFQVSLNLYKDAQGCVFRGRSGDVSIPTELDGIVRGVFGLDNRPWATPKIKRVARAQANVSYSPVDIARLYNFPDGVTGEGQCIGIIELGGGYQTSDIDTFYKNLGLSAPTLVAVPVDGGKNNFGSTVSDEDGEVTLDIEVAGTVAPAAKIAVYFAGNTTQAFQDAVSTAIHDTVNKPSVISISWGGPEDTSYGSYYTSFDEEFQAAATMGITVCAASGDSGSSDGADDGKVHVDYPASSAYVLGCGGTTLRANVQTDTINSEVTWNGGSNDGATGGGVSDLFALPTYQDGAGVPASPNTGKTGRGVPDVAGDADPATGYNILLGGQTEPIGGTSAVAPLMAGLVARLNDALGKPVGFLNPVLYTNAAAFRDITQGNNDTVGNGSSYVAGTGWDACTGLGVPDGGKLLDALRG
ncbi:MAG TPA: S53 family peptidase [Dinghuibacter sp.]|uniref:S53 family peptidase n=1 Tax=Dinghuibacter sp. TaxID=2024697 RepID=UPI002BF4257C|nr:S53 family peptidase [Dinghuibacter sp.]HTJ10894.1 S53 family peptidase [Dinghuibacter sp.]